MFSWIAAAVGRDAEERNFHTKSHENLKNMLLHFHRRATRMAQIHLSLVALPTIRQCRAFGLSIDVIQQFTEWSCQVESHCAPLQTTRCMMHIYNAVTIVYFQPNPHIYR